MLLEAVARQSAAQARSANKVCVAATAKGLLTVKVHVASVGQVAEHQAAEQAMQQEVPALMFQSVHALQTDNMQHNMRMGTRPALEAASLKQDGWEEPAAVCHRHTGQCCMHACVNKCLHGCQHR